MFDIITMGSSTVDVFAYTEKDFVTIKDKDGKEFIAYPSGSKILIKKLDFYIGGGGSNTATTFARMGFKTGYLGKIGGDENGLKIFKLLKKENITFLGSLGDISGYSIVLDSADEDRTILTYKGCNNDLGYGEIKKANLKTKWFYFSSMVGKSFEAQKKLAEYANKNNIKIAFNPSSYQTENGAAYLRDILKYTHILILNKEEAIDLVGKEGKEEIEDLLKGLLALGPYIVIITDGKQGAHCYDEKDYYFIKPKNIKVVETTGAGDAFASGFVAGLMMRQGVEFSMKLAVINAESVVQHYGAKNCILSKEKALKLVSKDNRVVEKRKL
ncbi:MAG: carbohydrate kinase family protein [archaeon]